MESVQVFSTVFLSVLVGAIPFLLIAVLTSGLIEVFLSRELVERLLPKNKLLGVLVAPLVGFLLPLCECGIIPVSGRLMRKGIPTGVAVAFMLANPILNPFPLISTRLAFPFAPQMVIWRMVSAYGIAVFIGIILTVVEYSKPNFAVNRRYLSGGSMFELLSRPALQTSNLALGTSVNAWTRISDVLAYASVEFFHVGRYFIIGSFFAAAINVFVSRDVLVSIGQGSTSSIIVMMIFAFFLSVCSEADAFVAASFQGSFPPGSLLAFMLFGPMVDVKNILMMFVTFRRNFVLWLVALVILTVFSISLIANSLFF